MAFDVSFMNPKMKTSSKNYGFLVDQLSIMQNQLESDGKLSPGDYDLLKSKAQEIYSSPGLSADQRSQVLVKISDYNSKKSATSIKDSGDIDKLNREAKDDFYKLNMTLSGDPQLLIKGFADVSRAKLSQLVSSIDNANSSGDDASRYINEYNSALSEYNDYLQALDDSNNYDGASAPKSSFAAYITTNSHGEISDVKVGRIGAQTGYVETNGVYGGLQIYGKINRKENGKNIFQLGSNSFSAADVMIPDPTNPGAMKNSLLVSDDQKGSGVYKTAQSGQYKIIDTNQLSPQSSIREGGWAEGDKGFLYQRQSNGKYKKYINTDRSALGVDDTNIIRIPRSLEDSIIPDVSETIDGSITQITPIINQGSTTSSAPVSNVPDQTQQQPQTQTQPKSQPKSTSRTKSPIQSFVETPGGIGTRALSAASTFLGNLIQGRR